MLARGRDHNLRRRRGLGGLLGGGGICDKAGGQKGRRIAGLGSARGRGFSGRPGVSMGLGLGCRRCLGRGGLGIVGVGVHVAAAVDVDAGADGMAV
jgi:hypothetical protein